MQNLRYLSMKSRCRRTVRREIFNLVGTNGRSIRLGPRLSSASFQDPCLVHQISTKLLACNCPPRQRKRSDISSNPWILRFSENEITPHNDRDVQIVFT